MEYRKICQEHKRKGKLKTYFYQKHIKKSPFSSPVSSCCQFIPPYLDCTHRVSCLFLEMFCDVVPSLVRSYGLIPGLIPFKVYLYLLLYL